MAYPIAPNRSNDWNAMHKVSGLSADERYERRKAARWARVASGEIHKTAWHALNSGSLTQAEYDARWKKIEEVGRRLLGAAERGEFPAPMGFDLTCNTTPEMLAAAVAQAEEWEAGQTAERRAA